MRYISAILLIFVSTQVTASSLFVQGEYEEQPNLKECMKAAEKGNLIDKKQGYYYLAYDQKCICWQLTIISLSAG